MSQAAESRQHGTSSEQYTGEYVKAASFDGPSRRCMFGPAQVPVVNVLLGSTSASARRRYSASVMVRDIAQLFVAGPPVVQHAMGYDISKEDLGGWQVHCRNGSVDNLAESEEEAASMTKRFLSYLPSSVYEAPPVFAPDPADPIDRQEEELFTIIPRKRTTTFDMRRAIRLMADRGSFFEIRIVWGTDQIVGFIRMGGYPMEYCIDGGHQWRLQAVRQTALTATCSICIRRSSTQ